MKLKVKKINFETGTTKDVIIHTDDAKKLNLKAGDRIIIKIPETKTLNGANRVAILQIAYSDLIVAPGEIGLFIDTNKDIKSDTIVSILPVKLPDSFSSIQKKIKGGKLTGEEINRIVSDAVTGHLSQIELASFITAVSIKGMDHDEMTALSLAETRSGNIFDFGPEVFDKHSTQIYFGNSG